jgi:hypothetical protein
MEFALLQIIAKNGKFAKPFFVQCVKDKTNKYCHVKNLKVYHFGYCPYFRYRNGENARF